MEENQHQRAIMFFLTPDDLRDLTGYRIASRQAAWLRERGWRFELDRAGRPRVSRAYAEQKMGVKGVVDERPKANWMAISGTST